MSQRVEMYREPAGGRYGAVRILARAEPLASLAVTDVVVRVDDLFG